MSIVVSNGGVAVLVREGLIGTDHQWVFEFSPDFELVRATRGDSYWPQHELLEMEEKLDHGVEDCPERESVEVLVWTSQGGWGRVRTKTGVG